MLNENLEQIASVSAEQSWKQGGAQEQGGSQGCSRQEALHLALYEELPTLLESADSIRQTHFTNKIELCAIINAKSGNCGMDCRFCSQSRHNQTPVETFPLLPAEELRQRVEALRSYPVQRCGIVTSGAALAGEEFERLLDYIGQAKESGAPILCASLGRLSLEQLKKLRAAGLTRYHHNLESSSGFYPKLCTSQHWQDRAATVRAAREARLQVCSGGLFGAGESWSERVDFAFELKELGVDNIPLNFLHPHTGTPLAGQPPLSAEEALRVIAVFRHILPRAVLRVCGGRTLVFSGNEELIFRAGANALMTGNYLTTQGQALESDLKMLERLGLEAAHAQ